MATEIKLSITRALTMIKTIGKQIDDYFNQERILISALVGNKEKTAVVSIKTKSDLDKRIQSDHDTLEELVRKRQALKNAVVLSNASESIEICGKTITVVEAIEMKALVPTKERILKSYRNQITSVNKFIDSQKTDIETRIAKLIEVQTTENSTPEDKDQMMKMVRANEEGDKLPVMHDPLNLIDKAEKLEKEIHDIKEELDYVLSEHNAVTIITATY